jgi:hypothetical protein
MDILELETEIKAVHVKRRDEVYEKTDLSILKKINGSGFNETLGNHNTQADQNMKI